MPRERMEQMLVPLRSPGWRQMMKIMVEQTPNVAGNISDEDIENIKRSTLATPEHVLLGAAEAMMDEGVSSRTGSRN